ncbi:MAG TPA: hypothetical protein VEJ42_10825 [Streptosporangiaceae bacterium]|nr:hypothetical protein [Streptosporangiaceae bacterium]
MANSQLQGWSADPFGLHEERYFSAGRATKLVRDGKVESYEDPPADTYDAPDDEAEADEADEAERSAPVPRAAPGRRPAGGAPPRAGASGQYARGTGAAPRQRPAGAAPRPGASGQYARGTGAAPGAPKRPVGRLLAAAALVIAITVVASIELVKQESPATSTPNQAPTSSSAAFVSQSAQRTLAERTADMSLLGTVQSQGRTLTISGTGQIDFSTNAMALDVNVGGSGQPLTEKEILVNGNLFVALPTSTALASLTGHRAWIQMPASQSGSANLAGSDPLSSLSVLEQQGASVQVLGTEDVGGVSCTGYAVTPTKQATIDAAKTEFAKLGYSPAVTGQLLTMVQGTSPPTVTIWLDSRGLVREMSESLGVQASGPGSGVSVSMVIDVSGYGSPVAITAPPPSQTISYQSLLKATGLKT